VSKSEFPSAYLWTARIVVWRCFIILPFGLSAEVCGAHRESGDIFAIAALALQLLLGSRACCRSNRRAFLGIGAYTSAILTTTYKLPFEIASSRRTVGGNASLTLVPHHALARVLSRGCHARLYDHRPPCLS